MNGQNKGSFYAEHRILIFKKQGLSIDFLSIFVIYYEYNRLAVYCILEYIIFCTITGGFL